MHLLLSHTQPRFQAFEYLLQTFPVYNELMTIYTAKNVFFYLSTPRKNKKRRLKHFLYIIFSILNSKDTKPCVRSLSTFQYLF